MVEGTLAKHILSEPAEVAAMDGRRLPLRMKVDYISFSAHVDYTQNSEFIDEMKPVHLVLVHGESNEMMRLRMALQDKFAERQQPTQLWTPRNTESVELFFRGEKTAKTIGELAADRPADGQTVEGVLVGKDFQYHIMSGEDLAEFTELKSTAVSQVLCIKYRGPFALVQFHLTQMFGGDQAVVSTHTFTDQGGDDGQQSVTVECVTIMESLRILRRNAQELLLEWDGDVVDDVLADAVVALILDIESHPVSVKSM